MKYDSEVSDKSAEIEGQYANYLKVGHNAVEFIFVFGQQFYEDDKTELKNRIITSPLYAKAFLKVLKTSIDQFEKNYGIIREEEIPD